MQLRRKAIVSAAEELLAHEDLSAFSIRKLATAAGVSVVTVYNLIGDRPAVLFAIVNDFTRQMRKPIRNVEQQSLLSYVIERQQVRLEFITEQSNLLRASLVAFDQLSRDPAWQSKIKKIARDNERSYLDAISFATESGELRGDVDAKTLSEQLYRAYFNATLDWAYRRIPTKAFNKLVLRNSMLVLLADATESFRRDVLSALP